jgi:hypothetical protein
MGDLISRLTNLFSLTKTAAFTIPGFLGALALIVTLWPPRPLDQITIVANFKDVWDSDHLARANPKQPPSNRICQLKQVNLSIEEAGASSLDDLLQSRTTAKNAQKALDTAQHDLTYCISRETSQQGTEEDEITRLKYEIGVQEKEREPLQQQYVAYRKAGSPLTSQFEQAYLKVDREISLKMARIAELNKSIKDRQFRLDEKKEALKVVTDRMTEPGRLRPRQKFTDFIQALTDHAIGVVLLSLIVGMVFDTLALTILVPIESLWVRYLEGSGI